MHQCSQQEKKLLTLLKTSRQERFEEACCSVCRMLFCCKTNREKHEDEVHGRKTADEVREEKKLLKANKPLVCLSCCEVFLSGLFVKDNICKNVIESKVKRSTHSLILIPEWVVEKYLVPHGRKRSWDIANKDVPEVGIVVHQAIDQTTENSTPAQNSFTLGIHSILAKQRKPALAEKRNRRVTFSPVAAVAFTSRSSSIIKMGSQKTAGESSPDPPGTFPEPETVIRSLRLEDSTPNSRKLSTPVSDSPAVPNVNATADNFFSPPLPSEGANGSPMMTPQMSSTPVTDTSERRVRSENETSEESAAPTEGIFSSLTNMICCAFQALPSVLSEFFTYGIEPTDENRKPSSSFGCHRRQRRRSATFTPYTSQSDKRRRLNPRHGPPGSPPAIVKFLRSP